MPPKMISTMLVALVAAWLPCSPALAEWTAFNDHAPGTLTHNNATRWNILGNAPGKSGPLKDINTGQNLPVSLNISVIGTARAGGLAGEPAVGTPAFSTFDGYVVFGSTASDSSVQISGTAQVVYTFQGLNPSKKYTLAGTAIRGGSDGDYPYRWTLFQIDGASELASAHSAGSYVSGLLSNQVAINTGLNLSGDMFHWTGFKVPGGAFTITCSQYTGPTPVGAANGPYGYAMTGFRLEELSDPGIEAVIPNGNNHLQVLFSEPVEPTAATNLASYSISNAAMALTISSVEMLDSRSVQLRCTNQFPYVIYTLKAGGLRSAVTGLPLPLMEKPYTNVTFSMGYVQLELFLGLPGESVSALTNSPKFPVYPDSIAYLESSGWPVANIEDNYGSRTWGWIVAPIDGAYSFAARANDLFELFLSPDERPWARQRIAASSICCEGFDANSFGPVQLSAGQRYYFELLHKEATADDYAYVAWKTPTNSNWALIPGSQIGNYAAPAGSSLQIQGVPTNLTVKAGQYATFGVYATGNSTVTSTLSYQWQRNGEDILGAYGQTLTLGPCSLSDSGAVFRVYVAVPGRSTYIGHAVLSVVTDDEPPVAIRASNLGSNGVEIVFSEALTLQSATQITNYMVPDLTVLKAELLASNIVLLTTTSLTYHSNYTVKISGVEDWANPPNRIAPGAELSFVALPFATANVGMVQPPPRITYVPGGFDVVSGGDDIGGIADQCAFNYAAQYGDFDIAVRIASMSLSDLWAKAGIMVRETLQPGSRYAAALATPSMAGVFFQHRSATGGGTTTKGTFPPNFPEQWLRLSRVGNTFTGYASYDGRTWVLLGNVTLSLPSRVYVGTASASRSPTTLNLQVRDWQVCTNTAAASLTYPGEPAGPSSRRTALTITEIMYKPAARSDGKNLEFLELYNAYPYSLEVSRWRIEGDKLRFAFPEGTLIPGGAYWVLAAAPADLEAVYGVTAVGQYSGSLGANDTIRVLDKQGAVRLEVPYQSSSPWPVGADGVGHSIVLTRPSFGQKTPDAWGLSDQFGGSPAGPEPYRPDPLRAVVINEFLAHTDDPEVDYVELYNHSNTQVDLSGCVLTDNPGTNKFVIPPGTKIPPRGFLSFDQNALGFALSSAGETIYFFNAEKNRLLDAVQFGGQENGISSGRWPDGSPQIYRLTNKTPGTNNSAILAAEVVLNEIMYHPLSDDDNEQYVELHNRLAHPIDVGAWSLSDGVQYRIPTNTVIPAKGYLVVARSLTTLLSNYPSLNVFNTVGNFSGKLSGRGERLVLNKPDWIISTNSSGRVETNRIDIPVCEVRYSTGGRWGQWADGGGSSLELVDPEANLRLAYNWADSDESAKAAWATIEHTGLLDHGSNYKNTNLLTYAQLGLLAPGECLVDNIEIISALTGTNCVVNGTFETGLSNWKLMGSHVNSTLELQGDSSARSLRVRASNEFWTGQNSCQMELGWNRLLQNSTATLRFRAKWQAGAPYPIMRLNGNWLEATGRLPVPKNLGTPGALNSRTRQNHGPAIFEVVHTPPLPAAGQATVVTARVEDPDQAQTVTLRYRLDPSWNYVSLSMKDDGTAGDAVARDGVYSATIPGQAAKTLVAFVVQASDTLGESSRFPTIHLTNIPPRECVIMFGADTPATTFGTYHMWITKTNADRWTALSDLSNESHDCTIVLGTRVIYNARSRFAGSPYHQGFTTPTGPLCHYTWTLPDDDSALGETSFNKIHQPGNGAGDDSTIQREQVANSFLRALGVPWLNRRYVHVFVNGNRRGTLMEDTQCPDKDLVEQYFSQDPDGWLYKMQPWFEFTPGNPGGSLAFENKSWCNLVAYLSAGQKKLARYRYNYLVRRTPTSPNDYTNVFTLIDAASQPYHTDYVTRMQNLADMENWMRVFAANHAAGNWDVFGARNSQNLYGYIGKAGTRYSLMMWDFNIVLGNSGSWGPGAELFTVNSQDPNMQAIYANPTFRRMYWRALEELIHGPLNPAVSGPLMDEKYNQFAANGILVESPQTIKSWVSQARSSIAAQLATENPTTLAVTSTSVGGGLAFLSGTAPVRAENILVNGKPWAVRWTSTGGWTTTIPLAPGDNPLSITAADIRGNIIPGLTNFVALQHSGPTGNSRDHLRINEIMYDPLHPNTSFVELYNGSTNMTYDLSGMELRGIGYTFPPGSTLSPGNYFLLAENASQFAAAYGIAPLVKGIFGGTLQNDGETLTLLAPGSDPEEARIITRVRYGSTLPWPEQARNSGKSLQLADWEEDNWRVGNWRVSQQGPGATPGQMNNTTWPMDPFPALWINEVQAQNITGVTNMLGQRTAWLELFNPSTQTVPLEGLYLSSNPSNLTAWAFPTGATLGPKQFAIIFADGQSQLTTPTRFHTSFTLGHSGIVLLSRVFQSVPQVLDYVEFSSPGPDRSYASVPDAQSFTRQACFFATPGTSNNPASPPIQLRINEWMADNVNTLADPADSDHEDWFELYNASDEPADLSGYYLTDVLTNKTMSLVPANQHYVVPPGGYLLVWADGERGQNSTNRSDLHVNFKLDKSGDAIALYAPEGTLVDSVSFGPQATDITEGRIPNGGNNMTRLPTPTPRAPNSVNNSPPWLEPVAGTTLVAGQHLNLQLAAGDSDDPPQQLVFSLLSGPEGAAINPLTGVFAWQPLLAPATNIVTVVVADNGIPSLTATQQWVLVVLPPPVMNPVVQGNSEIAIHLETIEGVQYQLQYKDRLDAPEWLPLGEPFSGTGKPVILTNQVGQAMERYLRLSLPGSR